MYDDYIISFVIGVASSLTATWLYDAITSWKRH